ncbi:S8 family serine peptidase [Deinococcus sp. KNUC1210]|uniref:S8 family serine peptidase n=1 Tax=Deinococcus sp. KNUC1210 TaxID=2917691 RepID=UPI002102FBD9|nr:S8 family serine peptidase [Deinococcus sp. KNUC1210]
MKMFSFRGPVAAAFLSAVLVACPQPSSPGDTLEGQAITLGYDLDLQLQQNFTGSWAVSSLPDWLSAVPSTGTGPLSLALHAKRSASVPTAAAQAALTGTVVVQWRSSDGKQTGEAVFPVQADLYRLQGQVGVSGTALVASDLSTSAAALRGLSVVPATPSRVIVTYRSAAARTSALGQERGVRSAAGQTLTLETTDVAATLARLRQQPGVQSAVPDAVMSALDLSQGAASAVPTATSTQALAAPLNPTDEYAASQWAYRLLGYPAVWRDMQQTPYTHAVTVAVLDTGVRYDHPDLKGKLYGPGDGALDVLGETTNGDGDGVDNDPTDPATPGRSDISHGTHVSGIIAANWGSFAPPCPTCSGSGVVGASYTAPIKVLPVRVLDAPGGNGSESDIALAVRYAAGEPNVVVGGKSYTNPHPAQIINLSLGGH